MKNRLIYENLDTSFVNLAALLRYLRARAFAGNVRVELGEYEGEIVLTAENQLRTREHDRASGRVAEGEEALQRLLIRAREPGGKIHVQQAVIEAANTFAGDKTANADAPIIEDDEAISLDIPDAKLAPVKVFQQPTVLPETQRFIENHFDRNATPQAAARNQTIAEAKANFKSLDFPFEFSNQVEAKACGNQLSETDWQTLLRLTAELLRTIDDSLAKNNLNFAAAFQKACVETAVDYPFLNLNAEIFAYQNGEIEMRERIGAKLFGAGINEALRRILEKLAANPKFAEAYRDAAQNILALVRKRKRLYDEFFITPRLERILGV